MSDNSYPTPVSDPEADGLPGTADDDSSAYDEVDSGREADGPDPAALPGERDEALAIDRFGATAEEARQGEPLDYRLAQEVPDTPLDDPFEAPGSGLADEAIDETSAAQARLDADVLDPGPTSDPNSPVSLYDHGQLDAAAGDPIGRLVEPDEGAHTDTEADSIAYDAGAAGGGATAEELAIHEVELD